MGKQLLNVSPQDASGDETSWICADLERNEDDL